MARTKKRGDRRIAQLVLVFAAGLLGLLYLLKTGTELAIPYGQDVHIDRYARENRLDKSLVAAVIYQESRYRAEAVSPSGATGLMQLMPDTARWIAGRTGESYDKKKLKEPEYNIRLGTYYLGYLLEKYEGDVELTLAAYNAGPGNVDDWLGNDRYARAGRLTRIPFPETRNYVETVLKMQKVYEKMYARNFQGEP